MNIFVLTYTKCKKKENKYMLFTKFNCNLHLGYKNDEDYHEIGENRIELKLLVWQGRKFKLNVNNTKAY